MIKIRFAPLLIAVLLFAAGCKTEPVYNVQNHPIPVPAQKLSLADIGRTIIAVGPQDHWRFEPIGPDRLKGTYINPTHQAIIDLSYSQQAYSIALVSSLNLRQEGDTIHKAYNAWIQKLEKDIDERLYMEGSKAQ